MIIVEGPDGAGKTNLVKRLADDLPAPVMARAVSSDRVIQVPLRRYVEESLDLGFSARVYDRHVLISGPIYTAGMTRAIVPQAGFEDFAWLSTMYSHLRDIAPIVLICLPRFQTVWANLQRDEANRRLFPDRRRAAAIYWQYFTLAARDPGIVIWDYTKDDYGTLLGYCKSRIHDRRND